MAGLHSVPGITLPPGDANPFFIAISGLTWDVTKKCMKYD